VSEQVEVVPVEVPPVAKIESQLRMVPIEQVIPYDNNPRRIPQSAIDAVAESIRRYGWQQPIVVDPQMVIIVGHTRRLAAMQLGHTEVPILVTDLPEAKAREYRLVDNRTGEMTGWDHDALVMELREFEHDLLQTFFPDMDLELELVSGSTGPSEDELKWAQEKAQRVKGATEASQHTTNVTCPSCAGVFAVRTRSLPGMNEKLVEEIARGEA